MQLAQELQQHIEQCHLNLKSSMDAFPWHEATAYQWWLSQTSYLVNHTIRLIGYALAHVPLNDQEGFQHWLHHFGEEKNHEVLLAKDLKSFNKEYTDFPELPQTSLIYQNQYYWIQKAHPSTLMGYAFIMEGFAARYGKEYFERIVSHYGPKSCLFVKVHIVEDVSHFDEGLKFLAHLDPAEFEPLIKNMYQSQFLYTAMIQTITNKFYQFSQKAA